MTPTWYHYQVTRAAVHIISFNDAWHTFFTANFRPINNQGTFKLRGLRVHPTLPSLRWGPPPPPAPPTPPVVQAADTPVTAEGAPQDSLGVAVAQSNDILVQGDTGGTEIANVAGDDAEMTEEGEESEEEEEEEDDDDTYDRWVYYGAFTEFPISDIQESLLKKVMAEADKNDETRLWKNDAGKKRVQKMFAMIFSNPDIIKSAAEKDLLTFNRVWTLFADPHYKSY